MRTVSWIVSLIGLCAIASTAAQQPTTKPVASVMQLHEALITPSSDTLFNVGVEAPTNDKAWMVVRNNAVILAESGNLLMIGNRARDRGAWMQLSRRLVDAAALALKAAEAKDADGVVKAGDQIVEVCQNCHQPYRDRGRKMLIQ